MQIITIGKRLFPVNQIGLVERFDPTANRSSPEKDYKSRVILLNRDTVLAETIAAGARAEANGFHMLNTAVSPILVFGVENLADRKLSLTGMKPQSSA